MRWRSAVAALVLAIAGCGSSQSSSQARTEPRAAQECGPATAKTLAAGPLARVYEVGKAVYGCSDRGSRSYRLGSSGFCTGADRVGPVAVTGEMAGYGVQRCGVDTGSAQVLARRLTDGSVLHTAPATSRVPGAESYQSVAALAVKPDGAVAWIGQAHSIIGRGGDVIEVHRYDHRGQAELDRGPGIAPRSLRLRGTRISWLHAGETRSAPLS